MDPLIKLAVKPCFVRLKDVGAEKTLHNVKNQLLPTKKSTTANGSKIEKKSDGKTQMKISVFFSPRSKKTEIKEAIEEKKEIRKEVGKEKEDPTSADSDIGSRSLTPSDSTETSRANTPDKAALEKAQDVDESLEADVLIRRANSLDLTKLKTELLSSPSIPDEFKKQTENLLTEYRRFLALKVIFGDTSPPLNLSPSAIVDSVWHLHLLMPAHYIRCCKQLGEEVIDHDSSGARDHEDVRKKRLEMTKRSYKVAFGEAPPDRFWDLTYQLFTERESSSQNGPSAENETTHVDIKVVGGGWHQRGFKMKRTSKMERLFNCLQKMQKIPEGSYYLLFDDRHIMPNDTPNSLEMVDGDVIEMNFRISGC